MEVPSKPSETCRIEQNECFDVKFYPGAVKILVIKNATGPQFVKFSQTVIVRI